MRANNRSIWTLWKGKKDRYFQLDSGKTDQNFQLENIKRYFKVTGGSRKTDQYIQLEVSTNRYTMPVWWENRSDFPGEGENETKIFLKGKQIQFSRGELFFDSG